ncbi:hypothetical protein [Marinobacter sp. W-8]|uniref:hypothetical protein n=1 Tax=Marinobacter sp. W-8 TaxID=3369658 RepID=UPI0037C95B00
MEIIPDKFYAPATRSALSLLKDAVELRRDYKIGQFLKAVDYCYERMSVDNSIKIQEFVNEEKTREFLEEYARAIINTPSTITLKALAILYSDYNNYDFSHNLKIRFVNCINGLDDLKVNLFIKLSKIKTVRRLPVCDIISVYNENFEQLDLGVEIDELLAYSEDFLRRGLILRDPRIEPDAKFYRPQNEDWSIVFGLSATQRRYASLLEFAKNLSTDL